MRFQKKKKVLRANAETLQEPQSFIKNLEIINITLGVTSFIVQDFVIDMLTNGDIAGSMTTLKVLCVVAVIVLFCQVLIAVHKVKYKIKILDLPFVLSIIGTILAIIPCIYMFFMLALSQYHSS